ncbi:PelD GGDEF domain-containing protein, partial [Photobacterium sanctipauli]
VCVDSQKSHKAILDNLVNYRRGADVYWSCHSKDGNPALAVLLPLTSAYEGQLYINRLQELLKNQLDDLAGDIDILGPLSLTQDDDEINKIMDELGAYDEDLADIADDRL